MLSDESWTDFNDLCARLDADYSTVLRSLIDEACSYAKRMKLEKWNAPKMVPDIPRVIIPDGWERLLQDDGTIKLIPKSPENKADK